ncbi:MAG: enoyl-CoA hydratase/isomerase family protein [Nitrospinae bacterium]|nr:enoyl-CoA hydratase/isomerase family protein [Nitrospinota bacterium]
MSVQFNDIIYEKKDGVARITLNRPETYNAFTDKTLREMIYAFNDAGLDTTIGVVVLTGSGDKAFCSGGDVSWEREGGLERLRIEPLDIHGAMSHCLKPIIARVNGYAIGAGNHIAYSCDFTIAAEHAIFGQNGPRVGSPAGGHIVSYLIRVVGAKKAREIWMLCRRYSAREALEMGLVNAVVPYAKLDEEVDKWCHEILALSPTCLKILKASFEAEYDDLRGHTTQFQRMIAPDFFTSGEGLEGATAFLERRQPDFSRFRT